MGQLNIFLVWVCFIFIVLSVLLAEGVLSLDWSPAVQLLIAVLGALGILLLLRNRGG